MKKTSLFLVVILAIAGFSMLSCASPLLPELERGPQFRNG
jgi:hypothetical protein